MEAPGVFADATALIGLARINRLDLLSVLDGPIFVTSDVWREVAANPRKQGYDALIAAREQSFFQVVHEGDANAFPDLDAGESSVLSAASRRRVAVLIDELAARKLIATNQELLSSIPRSIGVVGLALIAKRRGRIAAVEPILDALIAENFRIGRRLYEEALRNADEL